MEDAHLFRAGSDTFPIDRLRLAAYLGELGLEIDQDFEIQQFATGLANINYRLSVNGQLVVLRRPPPGDLPPGAHDMKREHRILSCLHKALPLAPESLLLCEDVSVLGAPFQIIAYRPGLVIKGDGGSLLSEEPAKCAQLGGMLVETLVAIHRVDADAIGLGDLGRPDGFIARQVRGWRDRAARLELSARSAGLAAELGNWLAAQWIGERAPTLLHSDFKLDNLILDPDTLAVQAIIDWDMGTRGDPLFDLATLLSYWTEADDPDCMHRLGQMPTALPGFPKRDEVARTYGNAVGLDIADVPVLRILAIYKLAVVFLQLNLLGGRGAGADGKQHDFERLGEELFEFAWDERKR